MLRHRASGGRSRREHRTPDEERLLPQQPATPEVHEGEHEPERQDLSLDSTVIKAGWLLKQGSRHNAPHSAKWKKRWCILQHGVLHYDPQMKLSKLRKQVALEHCDVSIDAYANDGGLHGPVIVLAVNASKGKNREERVGELRFMAETEREGLDWLQAIDYQVACAKRLSTERIEEGYEALASFLRDQRCRTTVKHSVLRGMSKYTGTLDNFVDQHDGGRPTLGAQESRSFDSGLLHVQAGSDAGSLGCPRPTDFMSSDSTSTLHVGIPGYDIPLPRLNVVIMLVGTRGDVQPFLYLARRLRDQGGHRVRVATHGVYRDMVTREGFLFYPLAGDPVKLSQYMVRSHGRIIPDLLDRREMGEIPEKMLMLRDILQSTWPACTAPDPEDPSQTPFLADAIISNPVTYGHIHCAEALGAPLHLMFPQPWVPTHAFPHPLAGLPFNRGWSTENFLSFFLVDEWMWLTLERFVNRFRLQLGLPAIRRGEAGANLIWDNQVPFVKMWSPSFVPKPRDWGPHVDVVGYFLEEDEHGRVLNFPTADGHSPPPAKASYDPRLPIDLIEWLRLGPPPIFVGFGSMVIDDTAKLSGIIVGAATKAGVRVVLQSSWSQLGGGGGGSSGSQQHGLIFPLGDCPHPILMPHMAAVVHHGGAGTTAAGLQAGKPTMVCPFFGDQFYWGEMVHRAGVGVEPVPIYLLTIDTLAKAFTDLLSPELTAAARAMQGKMSEENGVREAAAAFRRHLPIQNMVCDVSLFLNETMVARKWCDQCDMKMSLEVDRVVHQGKRRHHDRHDYRFVDWGVVGPTDIASGLLQGFCGAAQEIVGALAGVVEEPLRGAIEGGALGAAQGLATGVVNLVRRPLRGGIILIEKVTVGVCNQVERGLSGEASLRRPKRYLFHRSWFDVTQWGSASCWTPTKDADASAHHDPCEGISEERRREILNAYQLVKSAQRVLARLQGRPAAGGNGGVLDDMRVWWSSFLSLLKSTAFYRVLTESRQQLQLDGSAPDCFAGCTGRLRPMPKVSQESSWLADWTNEQIRRYQRWYQGRYHEDDNTSTTTIDSAAAAGGGGAAADAGRTATPMTDEAAAAAAMSTLVVGREKSGPLERDGSSEPYRTEIELALSKTVEIHPEAVQELAANLERAGIAGSDMNVVDFLFVFSRVVKRSKRLRRVFLIQQEEESGGRQLLQGPKVAEPRREGGLSEGALAAALAATGAAVSEPAAHEAEEADPPVCLERDLSGSSATWRALRGKGEEEEDDEEEEVEEGQESRQPEGAAGEEEEKTRESGSMRKAAGEADEATTVMGDTVRSDASLKALPPSLDELFRHYSQ